MTASTGPSGPAAPGGHVRWRRRLLIGLAVATGIVMFARTAGLRTAEITGGGLAVAGLVGLYLWRGPKLHKHLRGLRGGGHSRTGSLNWPGQRGKGLPSIRSPGHRRLGGSRAGMRAGSRHRPAMAPFRRAGGAGPRAGSRHRRGLGRVFGSAGARRRPGGPSLSGRRGGTGRGLTGRRSTGRSLTGRRSTGRGLTGRRRLAGSSGTSRRGSGAARRRSASRFSPSRRRSGAFRGSRRVSGGSRGGSRGSGRTRPGSRGAGSRRRSLFHPFSGRRRPVSGSRGRGGARPAGRRIRILGLFSRRPAGSSGPRARRSPARPPGRVRRAWQRLGAARAARGPGPARYAWWRLRGSPGTPGSRGSRRRALRNRRKAWRRRLKANPALARRRPWYAPWRMQPGGKPALRHRLSRRVRTWRRRHRLYAPRNRQGRRLTWRDRIARRWHIWRGHPGSGAILLGGRPRLSRRVAARARRIASPRRWRWLRRHRQAPPRQMPAWTGAAGQRINHHRQYRWLRGGTPVRPQPQPQPRRQRGAQPAGNGSSRSNGSGPVPGAGQTRGGAMDTGAMAESIREQGNHEFVDPQDVHDTLTGMHEIVAAMHDALQVMAQHLAESGVHPAYAEATAEAANQMTGIADGLQSVTQGGVMQGPGGGGGGSG